MSKLEIIRVSGKASQTTIAKPSMLIRTALFAEGAVLLMSKSFHLIAVVALTIATACGSGSSDSEYDVHHPPSGTCGASATCAAHCDVLFLSYDECMVQIQSEQAYLGASSQVQSSECRRRTTSWSACMSGPL